MNNMPLAIMVIAAELKRDIITKGTSIPDFIKQYPEIIDFPKEHYDYIVGQGKKILLAMEQERNERH